VKPLSRVLAVVVLVLAGCGATPAPHGPVRTLSLGAPSSGDPLAYRAGRAAAFAQRAADGLAHVLYALSPGGIVATINRTEAFRSLIARTPCPVDPDTLEALVLLESAGRPEVVAGSSLADAAGLTQILASTGTGLLGMRINLRASERLTRKLVSAEDSGNVRRVNALLAARRRVDPRFDPAHALTATCRYLQIAESRLGARDLALESYHMGIGNVQTALTRYGASGPIPYSQLYFDSSPGAHATTYAWLSALGDDSDTYLWRLLAARTLLEQYRADPGAVSREAALQTAASTAELALHPPSGTPSYAHPGDLANAEANGTIVGLSPSALAANGIALDPQMGALARRLHQPTARYRGLRSDALELLAYLGARVRALSGAGPLVVARTVADGDYETLLGGSPSDEETTGWSFDVLRRYRSTPQAYAFQYELERLSALHLIAWQRDGTLLHVTVAPGAAAVLRDGV
jgi:hypothetical protein